MNLKQRDFTFHLKAVSASGEFEGYGSVFDEIDSYREVIVPGAFTKTLQDWNARGALPPVLWQHDSRQPIGPHTDMHEDAVGLRVAGRLLIKDVQKAKEAHALLDARAISGLSIGFNVPMDGDAWDSTRSVLLLKEVQLWECSLVTFPANALAQVDMVKTALAGGTLPDVRTFEAFLREAGFSKSQAAGIATHGLGKLRREAEASGTAKGLAEQLVQVVAAEVRAANAPQKTPFVLTL
jgi:uncharacterized protein